VGSSGIERILVKGIVTGLLRYPDMLARHAEALHALQLGDPLVARLLDALVDLALHEQALDTERLGTILRASEFDALARDMLRADSLPFSFTRKDAEPERARAELAEAIQALVERPEVEAALAEATRRLKESFDETAYGEQQRLLEMRVEIDRRLANLMQGDEGA
jgi:DNA primase